MGRYVEKSLAEGEEVVAQGTWPIAYWTFAWVILGVAAVAGLLSLVYLGWLAVIVLVWFGLVTLHMSTTQFAVTNQRVALKRGWLTLSTQELAVSNIEEVRVEQTLIGRLFGFGRVVVTGTGEGVIAFPPMGHPIRFRQAIENARNRARATGGAPAPPPRRPKR
ncbi:MAG TPA: PH domain-containing protein [Caulobacterales bacterium]|nr:PH domain-containing protein [Caulobacterales bacterium]